MGLETIVALWCVGTAIFVGSAAFFAGYNVGQDKGMRSILKEGSSRRYVDFTTIPGGGFQWKWKTRTEIVQESIDEAREILES